MCCTGRREVKLNENLTNCFSSNADTLDKKDPKIIRSNLTRNSFLSMVKIPFINLSTYQPLDSNRA